MNGAKSVPFTTLRTLKDGSELVLLRESASMLGKRRRDAGDKTLPRLPDTVARLVSFTIAARTARRVKITTIKVLTTLLDPEKFPARELASRFCCQGRRRCAPRGVWLRTRSRSVSAGSARTTMRCASGWR
jgi:hypothetical protein